MREPVNPAAALAAAAAWRGTPYLRRASVRGIGADCVGLVRGLLRELSARDAVPPAWTPEPHGAAILDAARAHLIPVSPSDVRPGHVVAFRLGRSRVAHVGIRTPGGVLHVTERAGCVETAAAPGSWAGAWALPCAEGCEAGPDLGPSDLAAIVAPTEPAGGWTVEIVADRDGTPLARSLPYPAASLALAAVPPSIAHVERVD